MSTLLEIDKYQRKIISVLFRILIVTYAVFLLVYFNGSYKWWIDLAVIISYLSYYFLLFREGKYYSIFRLIGDYAFITFIIFQANVINIYTITLLFAPILNTHNHTGEKKSILLYILPLFCLYFLDNDFQFVYLVPFTLFLTINKFDSLRTKYFKFTDELNSVIDDFFIDDSLFNRPYKIYENAIPIFNKSKILLKKIDRIICLRVENQKYMIVNGSCFIWDFNIIDKTEFFKQLKSSKSIYNINLSIDNEEIKNNLISVCPVNNHFYCFILLSEENENFYSFPYSIFVTKLISSFFHRLSKVLDADLKQKKNELKKLTELEEKINYVSNSVNSMHFIRNKLGPVKSYLAMVEDFNRTTDSEKRSKIEPYLQKERQKLNSSILQILEKADYILTKSNNPFNVYQIELHGIQQLFSEIRRIWNYFFSYENFKINWNIQKDRTKQDVKYNLTGIDLVLSNWISNMYKYNTGEFGIVFNETEDFYNVTFYNSVEASNPHSIKFIDEYTNSDRVEIERRNSRGLIEVKDFLSQMDISASMCLVGDNVYFSLDFKKYLYNENTNN